MNEVGIIGKVYHAVGGSGGCVPLANEKGTHAGWMCLAGVTECGLEMNGENAYGPPKIAAGTETEKPPLDQRCKRCEAALRREGR